MNNELLIRLIKKEDLKILARLYCKVYTNFDVGEKWNQRSAYNLLSYWFERQPDLCFLAEYKRKVVGAFLAGIKPWWDGNHLIDGEVFVDPDYQKKGIGTELSKTIYKTAINKYNAKCFDAITFSNKKHPLSWYKKQGFTKIKNWVLISGNLELVMKKLEKDKK